MHITALKTPLVKEHDDLFKVIKNAVDDLLKQQGAGKNPGSVLEKSILAVTSKIVSYSQGRLVEKTAAAKKDEQASRAQKHDLVHQEAEAYLPESYSQYDLILAIKDYTLTVNAGVDESNAAGKFVLWPENMQQAVNQIWQFLRSTYQVKDIGVIMTDSRTWPLRWGIVGTCLVHCGFLQLANYIGTKDLFDREIKMVQINVAEAVAVATTLEMGEVAEQTPLALAQNIKHIQFQNRPPTDRELKELHIERECDVYGPFINSVEWVEKKKI